MATYNFTQTYTELQDIINRGDTYYPVTNSTTYADITTAVAAGQNVVLNYSGKMYLYSHTIFSKHYFYALEDSTVEMASVNTSNVWSTSTLPLAPLGTVNSALALKADLASPALTGTPTAPTAAEGDNSTQIATTAYADRAAASATSGMIYQDSNGYLFVND